MDFDGLVKLGTGGGMGAYGIRLIYKWFTRERQENSLYKYECEAHQSTKTELSTERQLRKEVEMELRLARETHENDRESWLNERDKDRILREQLKDEVYQLRTEVRDLTHRVNQQN